MVPYSLDAYKNLELEYDTDRILKIKNQTYSFKPLENFELIIEI